MVTLGVIPPQSLVNLDELMDSVEVSTTSVEDYEFGGGSRSRSEINRTERRKETGKGSPTLTRAAGEGDERRANHQTLATRSKQEVGACTGSCVVMATHSCGGNRRGLQCCGGTRRAFRSGALPSCTAC